MSRQGSKPPPAASFGAFDREMMARAVALAKRGEGRVEPNPMVGCVIAKRNTVIGEGYHRRFGGHHAEVNALEACRTSPRGATVYVSLEPCVHEGKTPPCTSTLIEAGVSRVVFSVRDPSPHARGRAVRLLRHAGIVVESGLLEREAMGVLAPFLVRTCWGRPFVIAKWAQSLDGRLATSTGHSKWITSEASRQAAHKIRARVDAVMVGVGTVCRDDPLLTARDVSVRRRAVRVVLDGHLRIPEKSRVLVVNASAPTLVLTTAAKAKTAKAKRLARKGVEVVACPQSGGRLSLRVCLRQLHIRDMTNIMVEGGPTLLTSFLAGGLVDEAQVFVSPRIIGGPATSGVIGALGVSRVDQALASTEVFARKLGPDLHYRLPFTAFDSLSRLEKEGRRQGQDTPDVMRR